MNVFDLAFMQIGNNKYAYVTAADSSSSVYICNIVSGISTNGNLTNCNEQGHSSAYNFISEKGAITLIQTGLYEPYLQLNPGRMLYVTTYDNTANPAASNIIMCPTQ